MICLSYGMSYLICYQSLICSGSRAWKRLFYIGCHRLGCFGSSYTVIKANLSNIPICVFPVACDKISCLFLSTRHRKCTYRRRRWRELIASTVRGQTQHASASGENLCLHTKQKIKSNIPGLMILKQIQPRTYGLEGFCICGLFSHHSFYLKACGEYDWAIQGYF